MYKVVTSDGADSVPVDLATLGQWAIEGRIGSETVIQDMDSGRQFRAEEHPFLASRVPEISRIAPPPFMDSESVALRNTSGQEGEVPPELPGWNWGAFGMGVFGLGWLWSINQRMTRMFVLLFPFFLLHLYLIAAAALKMPGYTIAKPAASVLNMGYCWVAGYLGRNGNRLAWRHRRFQDVDDFKACQRIWGWWSLALILGSIALFVAIIAFFSWLDSIPRINN